MIVYMLYDGNNSYIRHDGYTGKYVPVKNINLADKWEQRHKAANILNNALNKNIRGKYRILEIEEKEEKERVEEFIKPKEELSKTIANEEIDDGQLEQWSNKINSMKEFAQDAEQRKEQLISELSEVDKEITDINHYIELGKFNACQGYQAMKMLQTKLKKRRRIKDELQVLTQLGECKISSSMLKDINNAIAELGNRKYVPRVLTALFE